MHEQSCTPDAHAHTHDESRPSPTRTAVFVAMSGPVTTIKALIFDRLLCTSPFDVVVGVDMGQKDATSSSVLSLIRAAQQRTNTNVTQVVPMSNALLERRHTTKISHFAGGGGGGRGPIDSPAKLAALDWLADARYKYMWHLEDDAWSADFGLFASRYASSTLLHPLRSPHSGFAILQLYRRVYRAPWLCSQAPYECMPG